jgi:hypothetical protein
MPRVRKLILSLDTSTFFAAATAAESSIGGPRDSYVGAQKHASAQRIPERQSAKNRFGEGF